MSDYQQVARIIKEKKNIVAFTGAGISVDAGIPAFRGGQGLWEKYDPMEYAHIRAFIADPERVWIMLREMSEVIFKSKPSPAHHALAELEREGYLNAVVTQNVDGLHSIAGNTYVIEYHGNHRWLTCISCNKKVPLTSEIIEIHPYPRCEKCDRALKPDVVFFGENIPMKAMLQANDQANKCEIVFIIGTSGVVYPAAEIPYIAKAKGAEIIEINVEPTPFTSSIANHFFSGTASEVLPELLKYIC